MYREPAPGVVAAAMVKLVDARLGAAPQAEYLQGERARIIKLQNIFWFALLVSAVAVAVTLWSGSLGWGLIAAVLSQACYFYPAMLPYGIDSLFSDIPAAAMLTAASFVLARAVAGADWRLGLAAGVLLGLLTLIKAATLYVFAGLVLALPLYVFLERRRSNPGRGMAMIGALVVGFGVLVAPWIARNNALFGVNAVADRGGLSLYTRMLKDQMSPLEYRGAFYAWTPGPLQSVVGRITGFDSKDLEPGGRLQHFRHAAAGTPFYEQERAAEREGREADAVAWYYQGRAARVRETVQNRAAGVPHPELAADQQLQRVALDWIKAHPFRHLSLTAPYMWRGALVIFPALCIGMLFALRRRHHELLWFCMPGFGLVLFYALFANFEERYGIPALPVAVCSCMIVVFRMKKFETLFWYLRRPRLYPQQLRDWHEKFRYGKAPYNHSRPEAEAWCRERAVDTHAAILRITGKPPGAKIKDMYTAEFADAEARQASCPVWMGGPGDLDLLYWLAEHVQATRVVETGVAFGWSSLSLLLSLRNRPGSQLASVDMPYPKINNDAWVGCVVPDALRSQWTLLRYADREGLPRALRQLGQIDMCHYDSDKRYRSRLWAYPLLWDALRPGGLMLSDDIGDNVGYRDWCVSGGHEPVIVGIEGKFVGVLVKPGAAGH
jgi:predicted O-methyltransferase YrrM/4-amino-4-deoxy-L-arabinose transferase-like glycosyltransferase